MVNQNSWRDLPVVLLAETTSWKDLPIDLSLDILSRLPVKTLIRSTSVCKPWYALIRNPKFISLHINRSISNTNLLITPVSHSSTNSNSSPSCYVISDDSFSEQSKFEIPFRTESESFQIIGSVNGLICLGDAFPFNVGRKLFLWNPSVKKHKYIISSCFLDLLRDRLRTYAVTGFGFDEVTNDYKIVRIYYRGDDCTDFFGKLAPKVEVYRTRSDSWRRVGGNVPRLACHDRCIFVNGALYWLEVKKDGCYEWIISFDLKNEVFGEVKLPENYLFRVGERPSVVIMEFKGLLSVCVFELSLGGVERVCVWVMKDNVDSVSWTKRFKVVLKERVGWPLRFTKSGKLVMEALDDDPSYPEFTSLFSCDLEKLQFKDLGKDGPYTIDASFMESLVLLGRGNARFMHGHGHGSF